MAFKRSGVRLPLAPPKYKYLLKKGVYMLSFVQYIDEAGSFSYPYEKTSYDKTFDKHTYQFEHPTGKKFKVNISHNSRDEADVHFFDDAKGGRGGSKISSEHPRDAHKILSTVHHIIKHHATLYPEVRAYMFTSDKKEPSRVKLYKKFTDAHNGRSYEKHDVVLHKIQSSEI